MLRYTLLFFLCGFVSAQTAFPPAGHWISNLKYFENNNYDRLQLELNGTKLTGKLGDDAFNGTFQDGRIEGTVKSDPQQTIKLTGALRGEPIEGTATIVEDKVDLKWEARRESPRSASPPLSLNTTFRTRFRRCFT